MSRAAARVVVCAWILPLMVACGGGSDGPPPTYTVGGSVAGLSGSGLTLQNGASTLTVSANGTFAFPAVGSGTSYSVSVGQQPTSPAQTCSVTNGSGAVQSQSVTSVTVNCVTNTYAVGGAVSGLAGSDLTLQNGAGAPFVISANGNFTLPAQVASGGAYNIVVTNQPSGPSQTCTITGGTGSVAAQAITNVVVTCVTNAYAIGGTLSGVTGTGLVLQATPGGTVSPGANGSFVFPTAVNSGVAYAVTVKTRPAGPSQTCSITNGSGSVGSANISNVQVQCVTDSFTVGGTVSGLNGSGLVLSNGASGQIPVSANGSFTFPQSVISGGGYGVTVAVQPSSPVQRCTVAGGSGTVTSANVTDVSVTCTNVYSIGGTVTGLTGSGFVVHSSSGDDLPITANGSFTFPTRQPDGTPYTVTVKAGPKLPVQTCSVANDSGVVSNADVANVAVTCQTDQLAYVTNFAAHTITIYTVNSVTGVMSRTDSPSFAIGGAPYTMVIEPTTRQFAYVADASGAAVRMLSIEPLSGDLTLLGSVPTGSDGFEIAIDPAGRFLYVSTMTPQSIYAYSINPATGMLSAVPGSPFALGGAGRQAIVDPTGHFLYVANQTLNAVNAFQIDQVTGALSALAGSPYITTGTTTVGIGIDPAGEHVYAVHSGGATGAISGFSVDPGTGALTPLTGSPYVAAATAHTLKTNPTGTFAVVPNTVGTLGTVSTFAIATDGSLAQITGSPVAAGATPLSVAFDQTGRFVYLANVNSSNVSGFAINAQTGALTPLPGAPFASDTGSSSIVLR